MQYVRQATKVDCNFLAPRLRSEDVQEIKASSGLKPRAALLRGLRMSAECYVMLRPDLVPFGIVGVAPHPDNFSGIVWMLATDDIETRRYHFLRRSLPVLKDLHTRWPLLTNAVDERNTVHRAWLKWLGFIFLRRIPNFGVGKLPFIEFVRTADV